MTGHRITVEGYDGTGKSSLVKALRSELLRKGFDTVTFKSLDREYLNPRVLFRVATGEFTQSINSMLIRHRYEYRKTVDIDPALDAGLVVITDRGISSLEYKILARGITPEGLDNLKGNHQESTVVLHPGSWEVAYDRINSNRSFRRPETGHKKVADNIFESQRLFREGFQLFYEIIDKRVVNPISINSGQKKSEVLQQTINTLFQSSDLETCRVYPDFSRKDDVTINEMCNSEDPVIASRSIAELGYRGKKDKLTSLKSRIIDSENELIIRNYLGAVKIAGNFFSPEELEVFVNSPSAHIRETAAKMFIGKDANEVLSYTMRLVNDTDKDVRLVATEILLDQPVSLLEELYKTNRNSAEIMAALLVAGNKNLSSETKNDIKKRIAENGEDTDILLKTLKKHPVSLDEEISLTLAFHPSDRVRRNYLLVVADDILDTIASQRILSYDKTNFGKLCSLEYIAAAQDYSSAELVAKELKSTDWQVSKTAAETLLGLHRRDLIVENSHSHIDFNVRRRIASHDKSH